MKIKELLPLVRLHGRTVYDDEKEALFANWTCSGFSIGVKGTSLKAKVIPFDDFVLGPLGTPEPPHDWPCVGAVVDNGELINRQELHEEKWITLWESANPETHEIRVVKLSENARGKLGILELETDGEFFEANKEKRLTIEIIGDSITCGFGNEAKENNALEFHTSEENGWMSYAALGARALGLEFSMVCESGISAITPEKPLFPMHSMADIYELTDELYDKKFNRELAKWDFVANHNDIVVINLGTNDSNPIKFYQDFADIESNELWFHKQYKEFIKQIRRANGPDTYICCTLGSMDYYLYHHIKEAVSEYKAETNDERICCFEYIAINPMFEGFGAIGHPSAKTHERMGREFAYYVKKYAMEK